MKTWDNRKGKKSVTVPFGAKKGKGVPLRKQGLRVGWRGRIRGATYEQATGEEAPGPQREFGRRRR